MKLKTVCPACNASLSLKPEFAGRTVKCPICGKSFKIEFVCTPTLEKSLEQGLGATATTQAATVRPAAATTPAAPGRLSSEVAASISVELAMEDPKPEVPMTWTSRLHSLLPPSEQQRRWMVVCATNAVMHFGIILILAVIFLPAGQKESLLMIVSSFEPENSTDGDELRLMELDQPIETAEPTPLTETLVDSPIESVYTLDVDINDLDLSSIATTMDANGKTSAKPSSELGGRSIAGRQSMVAKMGGTAASELAVQRGLQWLAMHQSQHGGWSYDHSGGECKGLAPDIPNLDYVSQ